MGKQRTGRRSSAWWAALTPEERSLLMFLEKAEYHSGGGGGLASGFSECGGCSMPENGGGLCTHCGHRLGALRAKADVAIGLPDRRRRLFQASDKGR